KRLSQAPGVHGPKKRQGALSSYGKQLLEKQKAKYIYGIRERQFRSVVEEASRMTGDSGVNLNMLLERRFDNVIYRLGFAITRAQARQMATHSMFTLNGKKMNIPSHIVRVGDVIVLKEGKAKKKLFEKIEEQLQNANLPSWLSVDAKTKSGKVVSLPEASDFDKTFDVTLIIEYFSQR
ncbi:MAG: 30S ribosomal protein S4, partial [Candidatus Magasanikbacteria bacterium]